MLNLLRVFLHSGLGHGMIVGIGSAAVVDIHSFLSWKNVNEATMWDWRMALLRWTQGAVSGALMGTGLGAYL